MGSQKKRAQSASSNRLRPSLDLPPRPPIGSASGEADVASRGWRERILRGLDILIAVVALALLAPVIFLIAIIIRLDSPGPVIYRQLRIGIDRRRQSRSNNGRRVVDLGGRPFMIHKFRTMRANAEHRTGPVWAAARDLRTTRFGRFLRAYRLDEIPQFWDVLRGDMAVVGPRPERPNFVGKLRKEITDYSLRQRVRPGITGWAQVNQGYDGSLDDVRSKLEYDLEYVRRKSFWFDMRIMLKTLPVMLTREGSAPQTDLKPQSDTQPTADNGREV